MGWAGGRLKTQPLKEDGLHSKQRIPGVGASRRELLEKRQKQKAVHTSAATFSQAILTAWHV